VWVTAIVRHGEMVQLMTYLVAVDRFGARIVKSCRHFVQLVAGTVALELYT
jgi:NADH:ubiquinone oxidoreductase subunit B-like Fe-S oxidoreductase